MLKVKDNIDCTNFKKIYGFDDSGDCWAIKYSHSNERGYDEEGNKVALYIDHREISILSNRSGDEDNNRYFGDDLLPILYDMIKDGIVEKVEEPR